MWQAVPGRNRCRPYGGASGGGRPRGRQSLAGALARRDDLRVPPGPSTFTSFTNPGSVTVTDNLGGSATIAVTVNPKYS